MFAYDQIKLIVDAIEERTGGTCEMEYEFDLNSEVSYECLDKNGDFYTVAVVYTTTFYLGEKLKDFDRIFGSGVRDAFSAGTEEWYIHDVPEKDAEWYAEELDGEVIDLTNLDL